ncbi:UNVERIFIED_CONTAM: hypothetical protein FKN15_069866 [Acipenser sinensis]
MGLAKEWWHQQGEDNNLRPVQQWLVDQWQPPWEDVALMSPETKGLWLQWFGLGIRTGVLQRQWKEPATGETHMSGYITGFEAGVLYK